MSINTRDIVQNRKRKVRTQDDEDQLIKIEEKKRKDLISEVTEYVETLGTTEEVLIESIKCSDATVGKVQEFMTTLKDQAQLNNIGLIYLKIHSLLDESLSKLKKFTDNIEHALTEEIFIALSLMYKQGSVNNKVVWDLLWKKLKWHREVVNQLNDILRKEGKSVPLINFKVKKEKTNEYENVQGYL